MTRMIATVVGLVLVMTAGVAAAADESARTLTGNTDPVALPSVWRMVFAFMLTSALAIAAVYLLRRFSPKWSRQGATPNDLRVASRVTLQPGLNVYVVEIRGRAVIIAQGRNGIAMTAIEPANVAPHEAAQP